MYYGNSIWNFAFILTSFLFICNKIFYSCYNELYSDKRGFIS